MLGQTKSIKSLPFTGEPLLYTAKSRRFQNFHGFGQSWTVIWPVWKQVLFTENFRWENPNISEH